MTDKKFLYPFLHVVVLCLILALGVKVITLYQAYQKVLSQRQAVEKKSGITYKIILPPGRTASDKPGGILLVGDLLGTNFRSADRLAGDFVLKNFLGTQVIVPTVNPSAVPLQAENILDHWVNKNGVVLVDNFCTKGWASIREKDIYRQTNLSPGPYCFSEPETMLMDNLIKRFSVRQVIVYYDTPGYLNFIKNFLTYLDENKMRYQLVDIQTVK